MVIFGDLSRLGFPIRFCWFSLKRNRSQLGEEAVKNYVKLHPASSLFWNKTIWFCSSFGCDSSPQYLFVRLLLSIWAGDKTFSNFTAAAAKLNFQTEIFSAARFLRKLAPSFQSLAGSAKRAERVKEEDSIPTIQLDSSETGQFYWLL